MNLQPRSEQRMKPDRRQRVTRPWDILLYLGRRQAPRREDDRSRSYCVERFSGCLFTLAVLLLPLTLADGLITLLLLDANCEEANPLMRYLLGHGSMAFLIGKFVLTAAFLPVALVYSQARLFGTRIRVGAMIPLTVVLYLLLFVHQFVLLSQWYRQSAVLAGRSLAAEAAACAGLDLPERPRSERPMR